MSIGGTLLLVAAAMLVLMTSFFGSKFVISALSESRSRFELFERREFILQFAFFVAVMTFLAIGAFIGAKAYVYSGLYESLASEPMNWWVPRVFGILAMVAAFLPARENPAAVGFSGDNA